MHFILLIYKMKKFTKLIPKMSMSFVKNNGKIITYNATKQEKLLQKM